MRSRPTPRTMAPTIGLSHGGGGWGPRCVREGREFKTSVRAHGFSEVLLGYGSRTVLRESTSSQPCDGGIGGGVGLACMSWLRRGAMLSSPLTSLLLRAPPRVGSAPRPVAASLARGVSASIGGCARPTAATDAFSARRGFAGAAARRRRRIWSRGAPCRRVFTPDLNASLAANRRLSRREAPPRARTTAAARRCRRCRRCCRCRRCRRLPALLLTASPRGQPATLVCRG